MSYNVTFIIYVEFEHSKIENKLETRVNSPLQRYTSQSQVKAINSTVWMFSNFTGETVNEFSVSSHEIVALF